MKKSLSIAVFCLAGFASAANCFYAMKQILLSEQQLFYAGGDFLDRTVSVSDGKTVERKIQWNGDFVSSITTANSVTDDPFVKSGTSNIVVVHDEKELKNNGIEILSSKETKNDTTIFLNSRFNDGKLAMKSRISLINDDVIIEDFPAGNAVGSFDKIEMLERKDSLYILGWKKVDDKLTLYANQYFVIDENDPTSCTEWLVSGETASETDYSNVIEPTETGYVFRRKPLDENGNYNEYFFTVLKDTSAMETPDTSAVEPPKDTSLVDSTVAPQDTTVTPKDTIQAIAKQMKAVPVLKPRDHYIDLKGRLFSKQKKQLPYRVLF